MTDEQIDTMLKMHRYLIKCEIRHAFDCFCAENGNQDYSDTKRQEEFNNIEWENFHKWFKMIRDND